MHSEDRLSLTALAFVAIAIVAGLMTWLCVGWFGNQPLLTAVVAVVLVEVFLASFAMIALLLTERMTVTMLKSERRPSPAPRPRHKVDPVWFRLPDSVSGVTSPGVETGAESQTIAFPHGEARPSTRDETWHRRAA